MASLVPAVAYYRMSSDKQETSIADQRAAVGQYAHANRYQIVREYVDEGISGWKSKERLAFQELIEDAKAQTFKVVLCWDIDRFSRFDPLEANHYWYLLDRAGVELATVAQGKLDWHDLGGWLSASVTQHGKAQYVRDLARNVVRGQRRARIEERRFLGPPPLGYSRDANLHLIPGPPEEIALVRRVFEMRASGMGYQRIAGTLNGEGILTPRKKLWQQQSIKRMLIRETYIGHLIVGLQTKAKFEKLVSEPVRMENSHDPIIDMDLWNRAQAMAGMWRGAHSRKGSEGARLGGLMRCGRCNSRMIAHNQGRWKFYLCGSYHHSGSCGWCSLPQGRVEELVFAKVREHVLLGSREKLEAAIQRALDRRRPQPSLAKVTKGEVEKLDRQIATATERMLLIDADLLAGAQSKLRELKGRRETMASRAGAKVKAIKLPTAREIAADAWRLDVILREASPAAVRHALSQVIDGIRLDFEEHDSTAKRRRFRCTGGEIMLKSSDVSRTSARSSPGPHAR